jgi:hypothetical protein
MRFTCSTLFDITPTGVTGHYKALHVPFTDRANQHIEDETAWNRSRNQQRNWETLTQIISMRTQLFELTNPAYKDNQWQFEFTVETPGVFGDETDPVRDLVADATGVPMLINLNNSKKLQPVLLPNENIWFSITP